MGLSIKEMLTGAPMRLRHVKRYSSYPTLHQESTAEHSFYVGLFAALIADELNRVAIDTVNMWDLFFKSMIHDIDESVTGDFNHNFKYSDDELNSKLHAAASNAVEDIARELYNDPYCADDVAIDEFVDCWLAAKDDSFEGCILALADALSAVMFAIQEVYLGNHFFLMRMERYRQQLLRLNPGTGGKLNPYIEQAIELINCVECAPYPESIP